MKQYFTRNTDVGSSLKCRFPICPEESGINHPLAELLGTQMMMNGFSAAQVNNFLMKGTRPIMQLTNSLMCLMARFMPRYLSSLLSSIFLLFTLARVRGRGLPIPEILPVCDANSLPATHTHTQSNSVCYTYNVD